MVTIGSLGNDVCIVNVGGHANDTPGCGLSFSPTANWRTGSVHGHAGSHGILIREHLLHREFR